MAAIEYMIGRSNSIKLYIGVGCWREVGSLTRYL